MSATLDLAAPKPLAAAHPPDKMTTLGGAVWLWSQSDIHRNFQLHEVMRLLLPPIENQQFMLLRCEGMPVAFLSWAFLNIDTEFNYLMSPNSLAPTDWRSGDRMWLIDWIAPFSTADSRKLKSLLAQAHPTKVARSLRVHTNGAPARVAEHRGALVSREEGAKIFAQLHLDLLQKFKPGQLNTKERVS